MERKIIQTDSAPAAIGTYSQAVLVGNTLYCSGQIPLDPATMELVSGEFADEARQVFKNLGAVLTAAGGNYASVAKLNLYLTDLAHFATVNEVMAEFFDEPYPARAAVGVKQLPKGCRFEAEAVAIID